VRITGIYLYVKTAATPASRTDDDVYLGLVGTIGGREFLLDRRNLPTDSEVRFMWGEVMSLHADRVKPSVGTTVICQPNLTHVYLRKHGFPTSAADDAWNMEDAFVFLQTDDGQIFVYVATGPEQLSRENGLVVYLAQSGHYGDLANRQLTLVATPASCAKADEADARRATMARLMGTTEGKGEAS
jgi:hypothetical protein